MVTNILVDMNINDYENQSFFYGVMRKIKRVFLIHGAKAVKRKLL